MAELDAEALLEACRDLVFRGAEPRANGIEAGRFRPRYHEGLDGDQIANLSIDGEPLVDLYIASISPNPGRGTAVAPAKLYDVIVRVQVAYGMGHDDEHEDERARDRNRGQLPASIHAIVRAFETPGNLPGVGIVSEHLRQSGPSLEQDFLLSDDGPMYLVGQADFSGVLRVEV